MTFFSLGGWRMGNLRIVRIPLLERVVLEELADRWHVTADEALARLIREAAQEEVVSQRIGDQHSEAQTQGQQGDVK
jgi:hypothetical protein